MLKENPKSRPNIYQALREACLMQGLEVPIKDVRQLICGQCSKLMNVDLYRTNKIRVAAESTITNTGKTCGVTTNRRSRYIASSTTAADHP